MSEFTSELARRVAVCDRTRWEFVEACEEYGLPPHATSVAQLVAHAYDVGHQAGWHLHRTYGTFGDGGE